MPYTPHKWTDWDFRNGYVDTQITDATGSGDPYSGENFISSESILIAVGPPKFSGLERIYSVGVIQNFNMAQNKNVQQLFEVGSRDTILMPGRTFIQATIARIMFNGPSLMKALYADYWTPLPGGQPNSQNLNPVVDYSQLPGAPNGHLWLNLAATFFNKPMGIALLLHDAEDEPFGGTYLENCLVQAHNLTLSSGQTVVAENVAIRVGKVVPIDLVAPAP